MNINIENVKVRRTELSQSDIDLLINAYEQEQREHAASQELHERSMSLIEAAIAPYRKERDGYWRAAWIAADITDVVELLRTAYQQSEMAIAECAALRNEKGISGDVYMPPERFIETMESYVVMWHRAITTVKVLEELVILHNTRPVNYWPRKPLAWKAARDVLKTNTPVPEIAPEHITALLRKFTNDERIDIFSNFCRHCGSEDTGCFCWNDE